MESNKRVNEHEAEDERPEKRVKTMLDALTAEQPFGRLQISRTSWLDCGTLPLSLRDDADQFEQLWDLHPNTRSYVMMFGKLVAVPRWQQSYMQSYKFAGVESRAIPLPVLLQPYVDWANTLGAYTSGGLRSFNQCLVNWYADGTAYIGSHADDEAQLSPFSPIVTITLCRPGLRTFRIRDREKRVVHEVETEHCQVLVMGGAFQREFKHEIVPVRGKKALSVGPRISLTLRQFIVK